MAFDNERDAPATLSERDLVFVTLARQAPFDAWRQHRCSINSNASAAGFAPDGHDCADSLAAVPDCLA
jgi:hypothetical protein